MRVMHLISLLKVCDRFELWQYGIKDAQPFMCVNIRCGTFAGKDKPTILLQFKVTMKVVTDLFFRIVTHPSAMYYRKRKKNVGQGL